MKALQGVVLLIFFCHLSTIPAYAQSGGTVVTFTNDTLRIITLIASSAFVLFIIKSGYMFLTSTGKPEALESAKKTLKNAIIGLLIVLSANLLISILSSALTGTNSTGTENTISVIPIVPVEPSNGLAQAMIDAITGFLQNIVESATKPLTDGIMSFLTNTPRLLENAVISKFWLITLGITDALFVLVIGLIGLQVMSASTFGFEELEIRQILPRIGLAFLGAHVSLFLADYIILTSNTLVSAVLSSTGGLNNAWIENAFSAPALSTGTTPLITLIFMLLFVIVSIVLLLFYISRLIMLSLAAVLAPFIFLLWALPKFSDMAEIAVKTYVVTVFTVFVHVVIIQLASSFLTISANTEQNSLVSILVAVGLFATLLKTPSIMMQMVMYTTRNGTFQKVGNQIINVITASKTPLPQISSVGMKTPRKVVHV